MSLFEESTAITLATASPGAIERLPGFGVRAAIDLGPYRRLWFTEPRELLALEEAARAQRIRLEGYLGHVPLTGDRALTTPAPEHTPPAPPAEAPPAAPPTEQQQGGAAAAPDPALARRYVPEYPEPHGEPADPTRSPEAPRFPNPDPRQQLGHTGQHRPPQDRP